MDVLMILSGFVIAGALLLAIHLTRSRRHVREGETDRDQNAIPAGILFEVCLRLGYPEGEALDIAREVAPSGWHPHPLPVGAAAEVWARNRDVEQRRELLSRVLALTARKATAVPMELYLLLVDLSFALGFQFDELERHRARHGLEFEDPARRGRPREADRAGGAVSLLAAAGSARGGMMAVLGLEGELSRPLLISAYRRLAIEYHPDRFHDAPEEVREAASSRFREISVAYETLLPLCRDLETGRNS